MLRTIVILLATACIVLGTGTQTAMAFNVGWMRDVDKALDKAKKFYEKSEEPRLTVIFFYVKIDPSQKKHSDVLFSNKDLQVMSGEYNWVSVCVKGKEALAKKFGVTRPPAFVIANHDGETYALMQEKYPSPKEILKELNKHDIINERYYEYKSMLKENPKDLNVSFEIAKLWLECAKPERVVEVLDTMKKDVGDDKAWEAKITYLRARAFTQMKKSKESYALYKKAKELDPDNKSGYRDKIDFRIAYIAYENSLYKKAITELGEFVKKYPKSDEAPFALYIIAACHLNQNNVDKAMKVWEQCARDYPESKYGKHALKLYIQEKRNQNK